MPILKISENKYPDWSEITKISFIKIPLHKKVDIQNSGNKTACFFIEGNCLVVMNNEEKFYNEGESIFSNSKSILIKSVNKESQVLIIEGNWGDEIGSSGIFRMNNSLTPKNIGDPVNYERTTDFDNHYHECDEYWIIIKGSGIAVSEGIRYNFSAGDCIATMAGDHHDIPIIHDEIYGVYFETTLKGKKRLGHLWSHSHGKYE